MRSKKLLNKILYHVGGTMMIPVAVYCIFFVTARLLGRSFGNAAQLWNICRNSMMISTLGFGYSFMSVSGRFDFSVGTIIVLTALIAGVVVMKFKTPSWTIIIVAVIACLVLCIIFTRLYLFIKVPSMVFSLGVVYLLEAVAIKINSGTITVSSKYTKIGQVPWLIIIPLICMIGHYLVMNRSKVGYNLRALGANQRIAQMAGVDVKKTFMASAVLMGLFLGVGSAMYMCYNGYVRIQLQMSSCAVLWEAMYVVMIANLIARYSNLSIAIVVSAFTQKMLQTGILSLGINASWSDALRGIFFLAMIYAGVQTDLRTIRQKERNRIKELTSVAFND